MPKVSLHKPINSTAIKQRSIDALKRLQKGETRKKIVSDRITTYSSISRSIHSLVKGYNTGEPGHRQKMNTQDEDTLENWILELIKHGETVFATTVIKMV